MYAARINGGSVENEFSAAANNKEGGREGERRVEGERERKERETKLVRFARQRWRSPSKFLNFRWRTRRPRMRNTRGALSLSLSFYFPRSLSFPVLASIRDLPNGRMVITVGP